MRKSENVEGNFDHEGHVKSGYQKGVQFTMVIDHIYIYWDIPTSWRHCAVAIFPREFACSSSPVIIRVVALCVYSRYFGGALLEGPALVLGGVED